MIAALSHTASAVRLGAVLLALALPGCAAGKPPLLVPLRERADKNPVVLIPGITGIQLRDRESGRIVWGNARSIFLPRDGGYALALPVGLDEDESDQILPYKPILAVRLLGVVKREVYAPLVRLLETNGYRLGELDAPRTGDNFFFFLHDWRRDNVQNARELARQLERLRQSRGDDELSVTLICQSNAGLIGRYYAKYGGSSLEQAEAGGALPRSPVVVDKLILVGGVNGGSQRVLRELNRGRRYVPLVGRRWRPETLFTLRSVFDSLVSYRTDLFFDHRGNLLDVDLFDSHSWERFGWSVLSPKVRQRLERGERPDLFGDATQRRRYLELRLDRARRLLRLLARDPEGFQPPRYYAVQNGHRETPERSLLLPCKNGWRTLFAGDRRVRRDPHLLSLAQGPGDGHATLASQLWLSPREREALARPPLYLEGAHFEVILDRVAQRHILDYLLE